MPTGKQRKNHGSVTAPTECGADTYQCHALHSNLAAKITGLVCCLALLTLGEILIAPLCLSLLAQLAPPQHLTLLRHPLISSTRSSTGMWIPKWGGVFSKFRTSGRLSKKECVLM